MEDEYPQVVADVMASVPASRTPQRAIEHAAHVVAATRFDGLHAYLRTRRTIIEIDPRLQERELQKYSVLSKTIAREFTHRGLDDLSSTLAADVFVSAFTVSLHRWLDQEGDQPPLSALTRETLHSLWTITASDGEPRPCEPC